MNDPAIVLKLHQVHRRRAGRIAVQALDLALHAGQVLGLLGINGAGKSTTLAMAAGALRPDRGSVQLLGEDLHRHPERAANALGWLPERAPLWPELTVEEHLQAHAQLRSIKRAERRRLADAVLERLALGALRRRLAGVLSQGQRQRLGLACALQHRPAVLILDEPGNALDPLQLASLRQLIREEAAHGTAVLLSTHQLAEVDAVCDRVAILHDGALAWQGAVDRDDQDRLAQRFFQITTGSGQAAA